MRYRLTHFYRGHQFGGKVCGAHIKLSDTHAAAFRAYRLNIWLGGTGLFLDERRHDDSGFNFQIAGHHPELWKAVPLAIKALRENLRAFDLDQRRRFDAIAAAKAGVDAFYGVAGRLADSLRGTKSHPNHPRCPYRQPHKAKAWVDSYNETHGEFIVSWAEDAA